ncbi:MAG: exo-alpha-sialidase [Planctomycetota bacterium]
MIRILLTVSLIAFASHGWAADAADKFDVELKPANLSQWKLIEGHWSVLDGLLEQTAPERLTTAILTGPAFGEFFKLSAEFNIRKTGSGVRAAALVFRATGTKTFYWLHLDSKNGNVILTRSSPEVAWTEILRRPASIKQDVWQAIRVECRGPQITVFLDDKEVLQASDPTLTAGRVGFGTSEASVAFRNVKVEGTQVTNPDPLRTERLQYQIISRGGPSGPYQAFPDACRLPNGDILAVYYAGYGHIALPTNEWPRGGRICTVRSKDEGNTWSSPEVLFDGPLDDRDPHIAALRDGTLLCSFFTYQKLPTGKVEFDTCVVTSRDGGQTWDSEARVLAKNWAVSAPVRELTDGTLLVGIYTEADKTAYGGVLRSTDHGTTWSAPIPIDPKSGIRLDAETDVIQLQDGSVLAALRGDGKVHLHFSVSSDLGLTWSPVKDSGFLGHSPHMTRLSSGEILLTHRLPNTAMHVSRDDGKTWQGPIAIDGVIGAYPATVELKDKTILVVYYEEGTGSAIRAMRIQLQPSGIQKLAWNLPGE